MIGPGESFVNDYAKTYRERSVSRENEGTETEAQGVGQDMSCPRKLFLDERKSFF